MTGPWSAVTNGRSVSVQQVLDLRHEAVAVGHAELADRPEGVELVGPRVAEPPLRVDRLEARDAPVEVAREVGAQHLAVGHDVVARLDLVEQRDASAVAERLVDVGRAQASLGDGVADEPHPDGAARAADRLDGQERQVIESGHHFLLGGGCRSMRAPAGGRWKSSMW